MLWTNCSTLPCCWIFLIMWLLNIYFNCEWVFAVEALSLITLSVHFYFAPSVPSVYVLQSVTLLTLICLSFQRLTPSIDRRMAERLQPPGPAPQPPDRPTLSRWPLQPLQPPLTLPPAVAPVTMPLPTKQARLKHRDSPELKRVIWSHDTEQIVCLKVNYPRFLSPSLLHCLLSPSVFCVYASI